MLDRVTRILLTIERTYRKNAEARWLSYSGQKYRVEMRLFESSDVTTYGLPQDMVEVLDRIEENEAFSGQGIWSYGYPVLALLWGEEEQLLGGAIALLLAPEGEEGLSLRKQGKYVGTLFEKVWVDERGRDERGTVHGHSLYVESQNSLSYSLLLLTESYKEVLEAEKGMQPITRFHDFEFVD